MMASKFVDTVPMSVMEDYINCTICMNILKKTVTTSCCHRFCDTCIREWIDRNSSCPCCNTRLTHENLYNDRQFDSLIEDIMKDKERSELKYYEEVCNQRVSMRECCDLGQKEVYVETSSSGQNTLNQPQEELETVEVVFRKHQQKSLADHGRYFQSLKNEYEKKRKKLEQEKQKTIDENTSDVMKVEHLNTEIEKLTTEYNNCQHLVAQAYDRYLTEKIPSLYILPVSVSVYIVEKNIRLQDFIFQPEESMKKLQDLLSRTMLERHDEIIEYTDKTIYIFGPMCKVKGGDEIKNIIDELENGRIYEGIRRTRWCEKPVLQCEMKPGSEIVLLNCMKYESDNPPTCFVKKYKEGEDHIVDYYKCQDCKFNWICKSCIRICHEDHRTSVHVLNNKPTWACCYCPKKKKCCI
ncbi:hypothetical protein LOTGIDRAFT_233027 [Lottia gigantea]|uniref:RING-type domain-containing protein n=1 Tax=Lottia gigantea TaxID=225164 RepID=V4AGN3_LOTGI|nr:hypothetical protein LOTGIDRAFT_233027 [Lottia gigantea]ESO92576.1 hypothetical protein LOTGIDRAFT_233027 [Lottia gigantea]